MPGPPCSSDWPSTGSRVSLGNLPTAHAELCRVILLTAAIVQIAGFLYHPGRFIPGPALRQARERFEQQLSIIPGDIYVINHSWDAVLAGKQPHAVADAFGIILHSPPSPLRVPSTSPTSSTLLTTTATLASSSTTRLTP